MQTCTKCCVIVIGGGLSGLSAAKALFDRDVDVLVLEASDRLGGRLHTIYNDDVGYVDVGGAYVGPSQQRIWKMADELGVRTSPVYCKNDMLCLRKGKLHRYQGELPPLGSVGAMLDANNLLRELHLLCEKVPYDNPWEAPDAKYLDQLSLQEYLNKTVTTKSVIDNVKMLSRANFSAEPYEVSLLWALWDMKTAGGLQEMNSPGPGPQENTFIGGAQQIPVKLAERIPGRVLLSKPVCRIQQNDTTVTVHTMDGQVFEADYVIFATPPSAQLKMSFEPALPASRNQLMYRVPMGSVIKTMTYYSRPYWREQGFSGTLIVEDDDVAHPVVTAYDDTKPDGSHPCLMGFIAADKARSLAHLSKEDRKLRIASQYAMMFNCKEMEQPIHYEEKNWCEDPWAGGCYAGIMGPGVLTTYGRLSLRQPIGRLHFAGTETANAWPGYMEGAIQAGQRASAEILVKLGKCSTADVADYLNGTISPDGDNDLSFMERHLPSRPAMLRGVTLLGVTTATIAARFLWSKL